MDETPAKGINREDGSCFGCFFGLGLGGVAGLGVGLLIGWPFFRALGLSLVCAIVVGALVSYLAFHHLDPRTSTPD
jgi:ABC-type branched-subunit amino acid transport system permease subunit